MPQIRIKPTDGALSAYYASLQNLTQSQQVSHEGGTRRPFGTLLEQIGKQQNWTLVEEVRLESNTGRSSIRVDGAMRDGLRLARAYWEAKDRHDDLDAEIAKKIAAGYPLSNIIFEDTQTAILYQDDREALRAPISQQDAFAHLLTQFFNYEYKLFDSFEQAIDHYRAEIPRIAKQLKGRIAAAHSDNAAFQDQFTDFMQLCQSALNRHISQAAVDDMLIQHLMTERIIRRVFKDDDFLQTNIIAAQIEKVIIALTSQHGSRDAFLGPIAPYYEAIESVADRQADEDAKREFINTVYEPFFQGYDKKNADTLGIVYTPKPIVDFMCAAVDEALQREFGRRLGDAGVMLLDPATGTGNFAVNLLERVAARNPREFDGFYAARLHANEVMLLPYYLAAYNIERTHFKLRGTNRTFAGLCFVDTLDLAQSRQQMMFTEDNTARIEAQKKAPINVIIGNPPYNARQMNENDNNPNRAYPVIDQRIRETYSRDSRATNRNVLYDAYVKFFRWAVDRLGQRDGIVCYVSNNGFVDGYAFDCFRKHLLQDFHRVYHLDLGGNARKNTSGASIGNVFNIMVGVGITIAIRQSEKYSDHQLFYHAVPNNWSREEKLAFLSQSDFRSVQWERLIPNQKHTWLVSDTQAEFESHLPIGSKEAKKAAPGQAETIFKMYSRGVATSRDAWVYGYDDDRLAERMQTFARDYNVLVALYQNDADNPDIDEFVKDNDHIKWSATLRRHLRRGRYAQYSHDKIRTSLYRPFTKKYFFFDRILNESVYRQPYFFPNEAAETENQMICFSGVGHDVFYCLLSNHICELKFSSSANGGTQCFPFYVYDADGTNRRENITDWALEKFRAHYADPALSKWDIFHYVYGILHHPEYRARYAADLKRALPRIPFAPDFAAFCQAGRELADLHLHYERAAPYKLDWQSTGNPISYRVEKMQLLGKRESQDGAYKVFERIKVNRSLTLGGLPERAFAYRLGNRSALEWVIDQYRIKTNSGITSDPNAYSDDATYIVDLIGRVTAVSLRTVAVIERLAQLPFREE